jgi:HD-like signal output (HDOD) protein
MKRILFVDDEPSLLDGLRNLLRGMRREWDMSFACGGELGLEALAKAQFDVVVSDMRMPGMDGSVFLSRVKQLQPRAVRIVLSGQTDADTAVKTVFVAHQFLAKPCDAVAMKEVISRACTLNDLVSDEAVRAAIGDVAMLPAAPGMYLDLRRVIADPNASIKDVAGVLERDVGLAAKILQIVNSAFFGLPRKVSNVAEAASLLGTRTLQSLALALEAFNKTAAVNAAELRALQRHSILCAQLTRRILSGDRRRAETGFVAGVLHDIGRLVPLEGEGPRISHAVAGAYLLGIWGLPHPVMEVAAHHEAPWEIPHQGFDIVDAVYLANALAAELLPNQQTRETVTVRTIDATYLEAHGVQISEVVTWEAEARRLLVESPELTR